MFPDLRANILYMLLNGFVHLNDISFCYCGQFIYLSVCLFGFLYDVGEGGVKRESNVLLLA